MLLLLVSVRISILLWQPSMLATMQLFNPHELLLQHRWLSSYHRSSSR